MCGAPSSVRGRSRVRGLVPPGKVTELPQKMKRRNAGRPRPAPSARPISRRARIGAQSVVERDRGRTRRHERQRRLCLEGLAVLDSRGTPARPQTPPNTPPSCPAKPVGGPLLGRPAGARRRWAAGRVPCHSARRARRGRKRIGRAQIGGKCPCEQRHLQKRQRRLPLLGVHLSLERATAFRAGFALAIGLLGIGSFVFSRAAGSSDRAMSAVAPA